MEYYRSEFFQNAFESCKQRLEYQDRTGVREGMVCWVRWQKLKAGEKRGGEHWPGPPGYILEQMRKVNFYFLILYSSFNLLFTRRRRRRCCWRRQSAN